MVTSLPDNHTLFAQNVNHYNNSLKITTAASLSKGSLLLPHLGLWTQEGQPASQGHS